MSTEDVYLTRAGYEKLTQELEFLKNTKRRELSKAIGHARSLGDLKENAEYHAAKEAQAHNEKRVADLEFKLSCARIIDDTDIPKDEVRIGATVTLTDLDSGEEVVYTLVSEEEANFDEGKISLVSPVGKVLLGHKLNEAVEVNVPAGVLRYKIIKIFR